MSVDNTIADDLGQAQTVAGASEAYCSVCEVSYPAGTTVCPADGTRLVQFSDQRDRLLGKLIDERFEVLSKLGQGGMGDVYRAKQTSVGREVAIKVIKADLSADRIACKRFLREAKLLSRVSHPNVVVVHDMGQDGDGTLYLVMELVTGKTLAELLLEHPLMPSERIRDISLQVCDALEAAHGKGIIHRDLKPANILVSTSASGRDTVKVLDFGLAKSLAGDDSTGDITSTGLVMGTLLYISPEMITGGEVDARADLYSLGCLIYEMCSGAPPFMAETATLLMTKHVTDEPAPIHRSDVGDLYSVTQTLLRKNPSDRPADAATVSRLLTLEAPAVAAAGPVPTETPSPAAAPAAQPIAAVAPPLAAEKRSARVRLWILGLGTAAAAAAAALALTGSEKKAAEPSPPALAGAAVAVPSAALPSAGVMKPSVSPVAERPDAGLATVSLTLDSAPSADEVYLDGKSLGAGPVTIEVPVSETAHLLEFHKKGYVVRKTSLAATQDVRRTDFVLEKLAKTKRSSGRRKRPDAARTPPEAKPETKPDQKPKVEFFKNE